MVETSEEVLPSGLTKRLLITVVLTGPLAFFLNNWIQMLVSWWIWPLIWPLPMICNLVIFRILEKISPKFRLSPQEIALMTIAFWMVSGSAYINTGIGYWTSTPLMCNMGYFIHAQWADPYKEAVKGLIPPFLAPTDPNVINNFYLGGPVDWGAWMPAMIFWMLFTIALYCGSYLWSFLLRKPYLEIEDLPYVNTLPTLTTLKYYVEETSESKTKRALFDFGRLATKVFWAGFVVGIIFSLPPTLASFLPIPRQYYIADIIINLRPLTYKIIPGADTYLRIVVPEIMISQFAPLDVLISAEIFMFVFNFIYGPVMVATGSVPYTPLVSEARQYWYSVGPFKWHWWANVGITFGLGVYALWHYRNHFIHVFKAAFSSPKEGEEGLSYRTAVFGGLLCFIILGALFVLSGVPVEVAIFSILLYIVVNYGWIKAHALNPTQGGLAGMNDWRGVVFDFGQFTGHWGAAPSPGSLNTMMMWSAMGNPGFHRMSSIPMIWHHGAYRIAKELKTPARSVVIVSCITLITTAVFGYPFWVWFIQAMGGYTRIRTVEYHVWNSGAWYNFVYGTPPANYPDTLWYMLTGAIVVFICFYLRARFPGFILNPVGFLFAYHWDPLLIALVIKYLSLKIGGARWFEKYNIPFAAGFCMGYGFSVIVSGVYVFFTRAVPELFIRLATA